MPASLMFPTVNAQERKKDKDSKLLCAEIGGKTRGGSFHSSRHTAEVTEKTKTGF